MGFIDDFNPRWALGYDYAESNLGVRFVDLDSDGYPDMIVSRDFTFGTDPNQGVYLNCADGWKGQSPLQNWNPQFLIGSASGDPDRGVRFVDLDGDGRIDVIWSRFVSGIGQVCGALRNTGTGWAPFPAGDNFAPPDGIYISPSDGAGHGGDSGVRLLDLNGDGLVDIVRNWAGVGNPVAYINTGHGWAYSAAYAPMEPIGYQWLTMDGSDFIDVNGDGLPDQVAYRISVSSSGGSIAYVKTWLNTGKGWQQADSRFNLPAPLVLSKGDMQSALRFGAAFVDVNGDGLVDMVKANAYVDCPNSDIWQFPPANAVYLNTGNGWTTSDLSARLSLAYVDQFYQGFDLGSQLIDLDGNGLPDFVGHLNYPDQGNVSYKSAYLNTSDRPDLLETITHSSGLQTKLTYSPLARNDGGFYTRGARGSVSFPVVDVQDARYAVRQVTEADGLGGTYTLGYGYTALRQHALEGNLGYESVKVTDSRTSKSVTTHYRQEYPYIGLPWKVETALASGRVVDVSTTLWDKQTTTGVARVQAPYAKTVEEKLFDADSTATDPYLVKTTTVNSTSAWGDVTSQTRNCFKTIEAAFGVERWLCGRCSAHHYLCDYG